jgi:hypothetical protein
MVMSQAARHAACEHIFCVIFDLPADNNIEKALIKLDCYDIFYTIMFIRAGQVNAFTYDDDQGNATPLSMEEQGLLYVLGLFADYCYNIQKKPILHDWMSITQEEFHSTMDHCKIDTYGMHVPPFLPPSFPFKFLTAYTHQHDTYPEPTPAIDLTAEQWHTLSHDHQCTWHKLSDATKAFILGIEEDENVSPNCKMAQDGPHEDMITSVSEMPLPDTIPSPTTSNVSIMDADLPWIPINEDEHQDNLQ